MTGTDDDSSVVEMIAELAPIWLPGCVVDATQRTVEVGWGRGALQMSAVVGVGEIVDRCLQLPKEHWPERIEAWLRAVVAEGELATEEHRFGDVGSGGVGGFQVRAVDGVALRRERQVDRGLCKRRGAWWDLNG